MSRVPADELTGKAGSSESSIDAAHLGHELKKSNLTAGTRRFIRNISRQKLLFAFLPTTARRHDSSLFQTRLEVIGIARRRFPPTMRLFLTLALLASFFSSSADAGERARLRNLLRPAKLQGAWRLEQLEGSRGKLLIDSNTVQFIVTKVTGVIGHVHAFQGDLDLVDGARYRVTGRIKSSAPCRIVLTAMIDEDDWHEIGLHEELEVTPEYKEFDVTFRVSDSVRRKNRIGFLIGQQPATIWVQDLQLVNLDQVEPN